MPKITFWNTLAVHDIERARAFYAALGFQVRDMPGGGGITVSPDATSLVCLFPTETFATLIPGQLCDATRSQELIQSIAADTRERVDELARRAKQAGGRLLGEPQEQPYGYSCGFADPDGHAWAVLWMP